MFVFGCDIDIFLILFVNLGLLSLYVSLTLLVY